jgi:hypothetical protein
MSRSLRSLVVTTALIFAVLFTAVAGLQYWFLRWQLDRETKSGLRDVAEETRESIAYADTWNLQGYRRTTGGPEVYLVMAQNGTLIDTHGDTKGDLPGVILHVSLPFAVEYDHPVHYLSDVGEDWSLYVHKLHDGMVVLGVRKEETPKDMNGRFVSNAALFGTSVEEAKETPERKIDEAFDYAIIDKDGILVSAIGGIPLKTPLPAMPAAATLAPIRQIEDEKYAEYLDPVVSKSGNEVGLISVFLDVTSDQRILRNAMYFNVIVATLLWVITIAFFTAYMRPVRPSTISPAQIPFLDEGETVEFKSSFRWDIRNQMLSKDVELATVKTVVGFLNSENGGTLIIGISDSKEVLGLQADYASFKGAKHDRDVFELRLRQILMDVIGVRRCARWVKTGFCSLLGKELCVVTVAPSSDPVFIKDGTGVPQLYVRVGNSTRAFGVQEALTYAEDRWGRIALPWLNTRRNIPHPVG